MIFTPKIACNRTEEITVSAVCDLSPIVRVLRLVIGSLGAVAIAPVTPNNAFAQLVPDSTLGGAESSIIVPDSPINGDPAIQIEGGAVRGEGLFHSFDQFNVNEGQRVYFANPAGISTIVNRVTGNSPSDISGTLGVNGGADLFFINPNGVIFGPNATLDVNGSVVFSTAESLLFNDDVVFSTVSPQAPPLLTVSTPVGLQYGANPGGISVQGSGHRMRIDESSGVVRALRDDRPAGLQVRPNRTLALVGGDVDLTGGNVTVKSGRLELGSVGAGSRVALSPVRSGWALNYEGVENFQDIRLTQAASADASGTSDIQVVGRRIVLAEGSAIVSEILGAESGGLFTVQASELIRLTGTTGHADFSRGLFLSGLFAQSAPTSTGDAGDLTIVTQQLEMQDGARVNASHFGSGRGRNLIVNASESVRLTDQLDDGRNSFLLTETAGGDAGDLVVDTRQLSVLDRGVVSSSTYGPGQGGNLTINASDAVTVSGATSNIATTSGPRDFGLDNNTGDAGNLEITTRRLRIQDGAFVSSGSRFGSGAGGNLSIIASESVQMLNGGVLFSSTEATGKDAGDITIVTSQLDLRTNARVLASTSGDGAGGTVGVNAEQVNMQSGSIISAAAFGSGAGGNVDIKTQQIQLWEDAFISAATSGSGAGGNVNIQAQQVQLQEDALIAASSQGSGAGGNVDIQGQRLQVLSGGLVIAGAFGSGNGGRLDINVQQIELRGTSADGRVPSGLFTSSQRIGPGEVGNAGDLAIISDQLLMREGALVSAATSGSGAGGNVDIQGQRLQVLSGAKVLAGTSGSGDGGRLDINAQQIELRGTSADGQSASGLFTSSQRIGPGAIGDAGDLAIISDQLLMREGALVSAATFGSGAGGNVDIQARQIQLQEVALISASTFGSGAGGNVDIQGQRLQVLSGAKVLAGTSGSGDGGRLDINVQQIELRGTSADGQSASGLFTSSQRIGPGAIGNAGDLTIISDQLLVSGQARIDANTFGSGHGGNIDITARSRLTVSDGAAITVNSEGTSPAGNIRASSDWVLLDNGRITAQTNSGDGGDIALQADALLLLRNGSLISSTAGRVLAGGDGGDISVDAGFIVAVAEENSDITANAFEGSGGNISINTQGLLGIQVRDQLTPLSDITASSELGQNGLVAIDAPNTIAGADAIELPDELVEASEQIGQSLCTEEGNTFIASGRGGLPISPYSPLNGEVTWEDWYIAESPTVPSTANTANVANASEQTNSYETSATADSGRISSIVEAQGWVEDAQGNVVLTASVATSSVNGVSNGVSCQQLRKSLE